MTVDTSKCMWCELEELTERRLPTELARECPLCDHVFRGNGWDGIDAHWRARHGTVMPYEEFWKSLCPAHRGCRFEPLLCQNPKSHNAEVNSDTRAMEILAEAKKLAQEYRNLTGKPLGITGEVAEYEAARLLGLQLTPARQAGYDAIEHQNDRVRHLQIKGRCVLPGSKPGQRVGSIDIEKMFDAVLLVLLDDCFDAFEIHEAGREAVVKALSEPGSKARNERGALSVSKFKSIATLRWKRVREH